MMNLCGNSTTRIEWKKSYLKTLIDHLRPFGRVLEVGCAVSDSSRHIQTFQPSHHTIIDSDRETASQAIQWASQNQNISIIHDRWENVLTGAGSFDAIFFNDFPIDILFDEATSSDAPNFLVQKGIDLVANIKKTIPRLTTTCYSDTELEEFVARIEPFDSLQMSSFLQELRENGQISSNQRDAIVSKYHLQTNIRPLRTVKRTDPMLDFLKICLKTNMHKGSRFSCFSPHPISKFESPEFFDLVITNLDYDYSEKVIKIDGKEALISLIEKQV